jgi:hypothetical protein
MSRSIHESHTRPNFELVRDRTRPSLVVAYETGFSVIGSLKSATHFNPGYRLFSQNAVKCAGGGGEVDRTTEMGTLSITALAVAYALGTHPSVGPVPGCRYSRQVRMIRRTPELRSKGSTE